MKRYFYCTIRDMTYTIAQDDGYITHIRFGKIPLAGEEEMTPLIKRAYDELCEYFRGKRTSFTLPLCPEGTEFEKAVWEETKKVPYAKTATYGQIAERINHPGASRAVGNALNKNPIMIMIPCHRILSAARNKLGFACGPDMKKFLLSVEGSEFLCNIKE